MTIKTKQRLVTPEWATIILGRHYERVAHGKFRQRPLSTRFVTKYAADSR